MHFLSWPTVPWRVSRLDHQVDGVLPAHAIHLLQLQDIQEHNRYGAGKLLNLV
jgi:hypothetical protein